MSVAEHTAGPWEVGYLDKNGQRIVRSEHIEICTCWHHCVGSIEKQMEANALLIAAAPSMLALIEREYTELADYRNDWPGRFTPEGQGRLVAMCQLIATATGREPQDVQDDYGTRKARAATEAKP